MCVLPIAATVSSLATASSWPASHVTLLIALLIASATDITCRKIYNWTTYPLVIVGLACSAGVSLFGQLAIDSLWLGRIGILQSLLGMVGCGLVTLFAYMASRGGAGDVKLAAGIGALLGAESGIMVIAVAYILAAVFVLLEAALERSVGQLASGLLSAVLSRFSSLYSPPSREQDDVLCKTVPLAGFFALATFFVLVWQ